MLRASYVHVCSGISAVAVAACVTPVLPRNLDFWQVVPISPSFYVLARRRFPTRTSAFYAVQMWMLQNQCTAPMCSSYTCQGNGLVLVADASTTSCKSIECSDAECCTKRVGLDVCRWPSFLLPFCSASLALFFLFCACRVFCTYAPLAWEVCLTAATPAVAVGGGVR